MDLNDQNAQGAHPITARVEDNKARSLALRIKGYSYREIARVINLSKSQAHRLVIDALEELRAENSEAATEVRQLELERLDAWQSSLMPAEGETNQRLDERTVDTLLRIQERRARLLGLDAPTRWEGSGPNGGAIPVQAVGYDLAQLDDSQLAQLEQILVVAVPQRAAGDTAVTLALENVK